MDSVDMQHLIDRAAEQHQSKAALARCLGVSSQTLNSWRSGLKPCPPEFVALIAHEAKLPADQWLARAVLWRSAGKKTEQALRKALGKCLRATGAVLALGYCAVVVEAARNSTMYRNVKLRAALR